ncbi:DNA polymerase III subunit epsilon [Planctobacterium marinum]|uniref:DNA polymerase III subunit epsilon n=1 Tax=Planctobacterium marinum TaxID=1631968 RepID=UPI001E5B0829|nr:DNA polymerase III subunit epsilon [Planctobacterium marinum]MCC2604382.1 DNA polymerase III subunit epsilon [Planctobacterium marinum]
MRQIVLDTETTGIDPRQGHKVIEIGCVELVNRRLTGNHYHVYINPERVVEQEAIDVHGITNEFLTDKPVFSQVVDEFLEYVRGAQLVIHNAPFDIGFLNHELASLATHKQIKVDQICSVLDTLELARKLHPGQKNNLDALCRRYGIDNSHRELHGALLDSEILADVYLQMTGGQTRLNLSGNDKSGEDDLSIRRLSGERKPLKIIRASADELKHHEERLDIVEKEGGKCLWRTGL